MKELRQLILKSVNRHIEKLRNHINMLEGGKR